VTGGEAHEVKGYDALMELHDINPDRLLGDKGYDSDDIRDDLAERGIEPVIPPRSNRKSPIEYDREASQAVPPHRNQLRENRQSLSFDAMYRGSKTLD
jgi:IS5 family transposase